MVDRKALSESYRSFAKILATIGGSLFVAAGISATFYNSSIRMALGLTSQAYELALVNSSSVNSTSTIQLAQEGVDKALVAATTSLQGTFLLFGQGVLLSCFSAIFWYRGHLILKGEKRELDLGKYALVFLLGEILLFGMSMTI